jgi:hypothetical protein
VGHAVPQAAQFVGSFVVFTHAPMHDTSGDAQLATHEPDIHVRPAPHALPQAPQLFASVCVFTSQPSTALLLQSRKFVLHVPIAQPDAPHVAAAFAYEQVRPHVPQLAMVLSAVSQPLAAMPSQLPNPLAQVSPHVEPEQKAVEFEPDGHTFVQLPHALGSFVRLRHEPLQFVRPVMHVAEHDPFMHACPAAHTTLQPPQLFGSVCVFTSQPSAGMLLQSR